MNTSPKVNPFGSDVNMRKSVYKVSSVLPDAVNDSKSILFRYVSNRATVLDVGCACGDLGVALKSHKACTIYGMEYNSASALFAQETGAYEEVIETNLDYLSEYDYPEYHKKFDFIIFGDVLEHIYDPSDVLNKMLAYLKPDGRILISLPNLAHASIKAGLLADDFTYTETGLLDSTHIRFFTHKTIPPFLAKNLLKIESFETTAIGMWGTQLSDPFPMIPDSTIENIFENPHSLVCQYIMEVSHQPQISYESCLKANENISSIDTNKNCIIQEYKMQSILARSLLAKEKYNQNHLISKIIERPIFMIAPLSKSGCIYAPVFAKYCKNIVATIDDYQKCEDIYNIPRWSSTKLINHVTDYRYPLAIDFSSSPAGKSWAQKIADQAKLDFIAIEEIIRNF